MSGGSRSDNYHGGAKSEYLATYLFSFFGLVTPVPRPEDIGYDLVCSIADQPSGVQTFNYPFLVSVKSRSKPKIVLKPSVKFEMDASTKALPHIDWLFRLQLPLYLCVVDKYVEQNAKIYSTAAAWFIYHQRDYRDCGALTLEPRLKEDDRGFQLPVKGEKIKQIPGYFNYTVDLGHPLVTFSVTDVVKPDTLEAKKKELREAVINDAIASLQARLGIRYFQWFATTTYDQAKKSAAFYIETPPTDKTDQEHIFSEIAPTLFSLALLFKETKGNEAQLGAVMELIKEIPKGSIQSKVWDQVRKEAGL